ncbi:MAG: diphthine--ammonia ligase [Romboutsia sp.]|uniref:Dph6-related ATP pyrophosphatase n=1 Tax=Romboutsia sp. TaxID=1965302 RepID=UPI003F338BBB
MDKKFIMSFSGGKDSTLALFRMIKRGYTPIGLLVTVKKGENGSWTHSINKELLTRVSKSLDIPLFLVECEVSEYEAKFTQTLLKAKEMGASCCVFGDIDIQDHRKWCEERCKEAGIKAVLPLWQEDREKLVYEFIDNGFSTIIKKVNLTYLPSDLLGKVLTREIVREIKDLKCDPCGENGEYHTFVVDGPLFKDKIDFKINKIIIDGDYGNLDISI